MKLSSTKKNFEPCPKFTGRAVCVDVTPLQEVKTDFGPKQVFRLVFEIDKERTYKDSAGKDITVPWTVWSAGFTPSLHQKASLRKFLRDWMGKDVEEIELEDLVGRPAFIMVTHTSGTDGTVYANIKACTPHEPESGDPLKPSGKYVRKKDRDKAKENGSEYRKAAPATDEAQTSDYLATKVHVGRHKGCELRELTQESVDALIEHWLPAAAKNPSLTADDKRLKAALEKLIIDRANAAAAAAAQGPDEVPMDY